ncbi:hypothetical protein FRC20_005619 [Serendipita sp. 405]|nr:hypothetical protein FRC20_005619 [Serendipita sp. 405]
MRKAHKWVQETAKSKETRKVIWNIWVMLSLPVTWLAWSLIFFCVALISFVWTSGNGRYLTAPTSSDTAAVILVPRILVTLLFLIGCLYFGFVLNTFRVWALPPKPAAPTLRELVMNSTVVASGFATPLGTPRYFNATSPPTGQQGRRDGLRDLANINVPHSTKAERMAAIADHLDGRSTYSAPSMLGLDVSPGQVHSAVPLGFTSPPVVATPPTLIPASELPVPPGPQELAVPITTITEASSSRAGDPLMGAEARWARATDQETEDDDATHSPTFERSNQATALDSSLPDSSQPLAMIPEMSEFGSSSRSRFLGSRGVEANLSNVSPAASAATGGGAGQAQAGEEKGKRGWFKAMGGSSPKSGEKNKEKKSPMGKLADLLH